MDHIIITENRSLFPPEKLKQITTNNIGRCKLRIRSKFVVQVAKKKQFNKFVNFFKLQITI
jgi:hypothetical protein